MFLFYHLLLDVSALSLFYVRLDSYFHAEELKHVLIYSRNCLIASRFVTLEILLLKKCCCVMIGSFI